jgi:hypothetical protein
LAVALVPVAAASPAAASPVVALKAELQPKKLGASTTVSLGFHVTPGPGGDLPSLSNFALRLPSGMGFAATTLGLATCSTPVLFTEGPDGCPHESVIGFGTAQAQAAFGAQVLHERARVSIFMTRPVDQHTTALFYFDGRTPVIAPLVLQSEVLTPKQSPGSVLTTPIPSIPTAPDGPEITIVAFRASIGPRRLRYFKRVHHRLVAYRPEGIGIPTVCPRGGFVFAGEFRFQDGSHAAAKSRVPCPT